MQPRIHVDIALVQTARTPALQSPGAVKMQRPPVAPPVAVALSQRGAEGGRHTGHTALCRRELNLYVPHHMAEFPTDVRCECKRGRALLFLMYRFWVFWHRVKCKRGVYMWCVHVVFNPLSSITVWVGGLFFVFVFVFFFFFQKGNENFLANLWMIFILKF